MGRIDAGMSGYLHTYGAYRIPKGTKVQDASGKEVVLSEEKDVLVLTEKAGRQLVQDRHAYNGMLMQNAEMAAQKTQKEAGDKMAKDMAKIMAVFRALVRGDIVPSSDEWRLQEYSPEMYQAAKVMQGMAQREERRKEKSQWNEKEEAAHKEKMAQLRKESDEAAAAIVEGSQAFSAAQKKRIVEVDSSGVDMTAMKVMSLGSGVAGAYIDLSI